MKTIKKRSARQTRYQYMMIYFVNSDEFEFAVIILFGKKVLKYSENTT